MRQATSGLESQMSPFGQTCCHASGQSSLEEGVEGQSGISEGLGASSHWWLYHILLTEGLKLLRVKLLQVMWMMRGFDGLGCALSSVVGCCYG